MDHVYYLRSLNSPATFSAFSPPAGGGGGGFAGAAADWASRISGPNVEFFSDFSGVGDFVLASTNGGHVFAPGMDPAVTALVTKDLTDGLTNGCCLRISTPAAMAQNGASWMFPFGFNYVSNASNIGNDIWIQFRFKIPPSRLVLSNCGAAQKGWKWANFAQYSVVDTDSQSFSNTNCEHVLQDSDQRGLPQAYHQNGSSFPPFQGFAGGQITLQTAIDKGPSLSGGNRFCHYPNGTPACEFFPTDEWMTFMLRLQLADFAQGPGNVFDLWMARAGATVWTHLFHDVDYELGSPNSSGGGFTTINGGHLLTYETNRINSTVPTYHQYDQVIVSRSEIPIPLDAGVGVGSTALAALAASMASNSWAELVVSNQNAVLGDFTGGNSGSTIHFSNSMPWNPVSKVIEIVAGDHHGGTPSMRHMRYNESSNSFSEAQTPPVTGNIGHGYDHSTVNPNTGDLYHRLYDASGSVVKKVLGGASFVSIPDWDPHGFNQNAIGSCWWSGSFTGGGAQGSLVIFNSGNAVNGSNDGQIVAYNPLTDAWFFDQVARAPFFGQPVDGTYHTVIEYSAVKNCAVFGGGNAAEQKLWRLNSDGTSTVMPNVPTGKRVGIQRGIITADPVTGNFLLLSSGQHWELNPTGSGTWTQLADPPSAVGNPTEPTPLDGMVCCAIPEYGVVAYIKQTSSTGGRFHLYKR